MLSEESRITTIYKLGIPISKMKGLNLSTRQTVMVLESGDLDFNFNSDAYHLTSV